ncbi:hypothetical protein [Candidatus Carsonella ruddii]|uniref:Putative ribosomal protein L1 n=1 Tax=Candidatus Carsonella ruddii HC isolate Thao2000 TaxID=1202538 RepID=J3TEC7_CARRU|nr:hypothetical protein [Candidatus Carsonella ruddii]AFP84032.1 putative ribosomal protein L1 [Candidatus Carsonella ruddii HC isolate Thao2000]
MNNINEIINLLFNKLIKFNESIDININIINKKKNFFSYIINLDYSINCNKKFLFLTNFNKIENNMYFGELYFEKFLKKEIFFDKIYYNNSYEKYIINNNLQKKFSKKKFLLNNYKSKINEINSNLLKIVINKNNFINFKIGNIKFNKNMIKINVINSLNSIKKILFLNNIIIKNIYISTTMGKGYLIK